MALSGKRVVFGLAAAFILTSACSSPAEAPPTKTVASATAAEVSPTAALGQVPSTTLHQLTGADAAVTLPSFVPVENPKGPGPLSRFDFLAPVSAYGDRFVVQQSPVDGRDESPSFYAYSLKGERQQLLWKGEPGLSDIVASTDGPWLATLRTVRHLPFEKWKLILHNSETGAEVQVAESQPGITNIAGLPIGLPLGVAPLPQVGGGKVVWSQWEHSGDGAAKVMYVFDIASGVTKELARAEDASLRDIRMPVIAQSTVAWIDVDLKARTALIRTMQLGDGRVSDVITDKLPWMVALSDDASLLFWDDDFKGKMVTDLATGTSTRFADELGDGVFVKGHKVTWSISLAVASHRPGYYDSSAGLIYFVEPGLGMVVGEQRLLDGWFAWQERGTLPDGLPDFANAKYLFVRT